MARYRSGTVSVEVDVDVWQVLEEVSDKALLEEIADRGLSSSGGTVPLYALHERLDRWAAQLGPSHPLYYDLLSAATECRLSRPAPEKPGPLLTAMKQ